MKFKETLDRLQSALTASGSYGWNAPVYVVREFELPEKASVIHDIVWEKDHFEIRIKRIKRQEESGDNS